MYTEDDSNLAMKSSFFSPDSSKLPPLAVKKKVIFASLVWLMASTWFCWGLWGQGPGLGGSLGSMCLAVLPATSLQVWSIPCKGMRLHSMLLWLGTWQLGGGDAETSSSCLVSDIFNYKKGWVNKGLPKCLCSLEKCHCCCRSIGNAILVSSSGCPSLFWQCFPVPHIWLQLLVFSLNTSLLQYKPAWAWLCWCAPCWAKHSPVKLPPRLAGQHLQNSLFSQIMFSVFPSKTRECW